MVAGGGRQGAVRRCELPHSRGGSHGDGKVAARGAEHTGGVVGGQTALGNEVVVVIQKTPLIPSPGRKKYKLLVTSRTSSMQKEMQQPGVTRARALSTAGGRSSSVPFVEGSSL